MSLSQALNQFAQNLGRYGRFTGRHVIYRRHDYIPSVRRHRSRLSERRGLDTIGTTIVYAYLRSIVVDNRAWMLPAQGKVTRARIYKVARADYREEPVLLVILLIEFLVALFDPGKDSGRLFTLLRGERFSSSPKVNPPSLPDDG